jgi:hypothetical protein
MKSTIQGMIAAALMGASGSAMALPTLVGTTTNPTGINGVVVDGVLYDVTFSTASYNATFSSTSPTFLSNMSGAYDASVALTSALSTLGVSGLEGSPCTFSSGCQVNVPYSNSGGAIYEWSGACNDSATNGCAAPPWETVPVGNSGGWTLTGSLSEIPGGTYVWAIFRPADPTTLLAALKAELHGVEPEGLEDKAASASNQVEAACDSLTNLVSQAKSQSGNRLTAPQAAQFISDAQTIEIALGCRSAVTKLDARSE